MSTALQALRTYAASVLLHIRARTELEPLTATVCSLVLSQAVHTHDTPDVEHDQRMPGILRRRYVQCTYFTVLARFQPALRIPVQWPLRMHPGTVKFACLTEYNRSISLTPQVMSLSEMLVYGMSPTLGPLVCYAAAHKPLVSSHTMPLCTLCIVAQMAAQMAAQVAARASWYRGRWCRRRRSRLPGWTCPGWPPAVRRGASRPCGLALAASRQRRRTRALLAALVWHEAHSSRPRRLCMAASERTSGSSGPLQAVHDGPRPVALREAFMGRVSAVVNVRRYLRTARVRCGGSLSLCLRARLSGCELSRNMIFFVLHLVASRRIRL